MKTSATHAVRRGETALAVLAITAALVSFPILTTVGVTLSYGPVYTTFGIRRWTFLLVVPATILNFPLFAYALARRTFV
ncbi:MAG: hypothetical protein ABEJ47_04115 [Halorhabdus sp.]